jgi:hypothetical protein
MQRGIGVLPCIENQINRLFHADKQKINPLK